MQVCPKQEPWQQRQEQVLLKAWEAAGQLVQLQAKESLLALMQLLAGAAAVLQSCWLLVPAGAAVVLKLGLLVRAVQKRAVNLLEGAQ